MVSERNVLIVGGGAAGMTAALAIAARGGKATLLAGSLAAGSSYWAQGGISAAIGADDSTDIHFQDTILCGGGINDEATVRLLVDEAAARVQDLVDIGVQFDRDAAGAISLGLEGGHSRRRIVHAGGATTGYYVAKGLAAEVLKTPGVDVVERFVDRLIVENGTVVGVELRPALDGDGTSDKLYGPVLLTTGGCGGLYGRSTNPPGVNGSGIRLAWEAGAVLADMEFVQFHPTALDLSGREAGQVLLLTEALRGEGAYLLDSSGSRFMTEGPLAHPLAELAPRDIVARAIFRARQTGPVHLTLRHRPADEVRTHFPNLVKLVAERGYDLATDLLPVAPAAHYLMGGVLAGLDGRTSMPGLFAAGEVACTGAQGANRLASNSLLECLVFGRRAALAALEMLQGLSSPDLLHDGALSALAHRFPEESTPFAGMAVPRPEGRTLDRSEIAALLDDKLGVVRTDESSREALAAFSEDPDTAVARRIAVGAFLRTESRGGHFRLDHPYSSDQWQGRILQRKDAEPEFAAVGSLVAANQG